MGEQLKVSYLADALETLSSQIGMQHPETAIMLMQAANRLLFLRSELLHCYKRMAEKETLPYGERKHEHDTV